MDCLIEKIGIAPEGAQYISEGCIGPLAELTFSSFLHYNRTSPLFELSARPTYDVSLICSLAQLYPELEQVAKAVAENPPTWQPGPVESFHQNIEEYLTERGCSERFILDVLNEMIRLEKLEPFFHQEQIISAESSSAGRGKAVLSGIAKTDDELLQLSDFVTDAENRFSSFELDCFHKSYPAFALRFVNSHGTRTLVEKVLAVRRELEIACTKFSAVAGNSGNITKIFDTEDDAKAFIEELDTTYAEPVINLLPRSEITYDDFESFVRWSLLALLAARCDVVKHADGKWTTISPERFCVQIPVDNLILVNEISETLFPFLMKTSAQPQELTYHLERLNESQNISIMQCDTDFLTLLLRGVQAVSEAKRILRGLLKEFDFRLLPGETYSCASGTVVRVRLAAGGS